MVGSTYTLNVALADSCALPECPLPISKSTHHACMTPQELAVDDVVVFEVKGTYTLKVHIFR